MTDKSPSSQAAYPTTGAIRLALRAVLGNVVVLLLLVGCERLFFDRGFYSSLIQHPFWIIVILAAVQDGLYVGVLVAVAATVLMDWPARPPESDITAHYIQVAILPLQWLFAALCIGLFRQAEIHRAKANEAEMARLQQVNEVLAADIVSLETDINRAQLDTLSRDKPPDRHAELVSRVLALQDAEPATLAPRFDALAKASSTSPSSLLVMNAEGNLEPPPGDEVGYPIHTELPMESDHYTALRTNSYIVIQRTNPTEHLPKFPYLVLVGIPSPDRRALLGAVVLLAKTQKSAKRAARHARFIASQMAPVLARMRLPKIAVPSDNASRVNRVRKLFRG